MKQSDIVTLIFITGIGMLSSFLLANWIMGDPDLQSTKFKKMTAVITASIEEPDPEIFNATAINPTIEVHVGDCTDIDGNGILDDDELVACGRLERPTEDDSNEESTEAEEVEENNESESGE